MSTYILHLFNYCIYLHIISRYHAALYIVEIRIPIENM